MIVLFNIILIQLFMKKFNLCGLLTVYDMTIAPVGCYIINFPNRYVQN
jgi:hypothetical protein